MPLNCTLVTARGAVIATALALLTAADKPRPAHVIAPLGKLSVAAGDSCDSVFVWSRVGWAEQEYQGSLRAWDPAVQFPRSHLMLTLNELGAAVRFDGPIDLTVLAEHGARKIEYDFMPVGGLGTFGAHGLYGVSYEPEGKLTHPRVLVSSLSHRIDSAMVRALRVASDSGNLLPLPANGSRAVELRLTLGNWPRHDSLAVTGVLFRVRQPVFDQVSYPMGDSTKTVAPLYPSEALSAGMDGEVDVEMVVRADGTVDPRSILVPRATATPFVRQVIGVLPKTRFKAASVAGCPVAALLTQPFAFTILR